MGVKTEVDLVLDKMIKPIAETKYNKGLVQFIQKEKEKKTEKEQKYLTV